MITAARQFGANGLGVEIVPDLVRKSVEAARQAGVADRASFRVNDIFETDPGRATVVTMYLLPEFNMQLRPSLLKLAPGVRIRTTTRRSTGPAAGCSAGAGGLRARPRAEWAG